MKFTGNPILTLSLKAMAQPKYFYKQRRNKSPNVSYIQKRFKNRWRKAGVIIRLWRFQYKPYARIQTYSGAIFRCRGIYAVVNLRGGGEYGKKWHEAGTKHRKQNVFNDFIAAAEYLIANKYTNPSKIAIQGGSNGGLLVGACMTQRPDLFKVALPAVGVMDMLRFQKFTIGWAWTGDYGSSDNEDDFKYLYEYSPLHNIREGVEYPATLVTTADHDDRVVPAHSYKFISELQYKHKGDNPVLIRIETMAGHGAGKPTAKQIEEAADILSFTMYNLQMEPR